MVGGDNSVLSAHSACIYGTLVGIRHLVVAEISLYNVGSLARYSFAGSLALLVRSVAAGSPALCSILAAPVGSCLVYPLASSHLFFGPPSGALAGSGSCIEVGYRTTECPVDRDRAGTIAFYPVLLLEPGLGVHSV